VADGAAARQPQRRIQAIFTPLTGATARTPYVIDEFGVGLALAGVLLGYLFWRGRAALSSATALHT
jgi:hypothetical protein